MRAVLSAGDALSQSSDSPARTSRFNGVLPSARTLSLNELSAPRAHPKWIRNKAIVFVYQPIDDSRDLIDVDVRSAVLQAAQSLFVSLLNK